MQHKCNKMHGKTGLRFLLPATAILITLICIDILNKHSALLYGSLYSAYLDINSPVEIVRDSRCKEKPGLHSAAICSISKETLPYIDEWTDYHLAIGFEKIYVYDNSDNFELQEWHNNLQDEVREHIEIKHFPGLRMQRPAYQDCTQQIRKKQAHSWIAYFDLDEFLVIRDLEKYPYIMDFLDDLPGFTGALSINWVMFYTNNQLEYEAKPVTYRFQKRQEAGTNNHIKTIARAEAVQLVFPHYVRFKPEFAFMSAADTSGNKVHRSFNENLTDDAVVLYHYTTKSLEEYMGKCKRGSTAPKEMWATYPFCWSSERILNSFPPKLETVTDSAAWMFLKRRVPKYELYS